jgi:CubicO group peptidase (beta-lactamase class C family)
MMPWRRDRRRGWIVAAAALGALAALGSRRVAQAQSLSTSTVDAAVMQGIRRGLYPGAIVVIGRRDSILYSRGYGRFTWSSSSAVPRPDSTLWDIASISKVVGTTAAMMRLVDDGRVKLDAPVRRYLPRFSGGAKSGVTVRMLLDHTSGLRSYAPFYRRARNRAKLIDLLYAEPLARTPGDSAVYSDLNAMLLGLLVERVSGVPLDGFVARDVLAPMGMRQTMYRPPPSLRRRVVPAGMWRGRPVPGDLHDQNARLLGGVAGHAGIFSTGLDLARFAQVWLRQGRTERGTAWVKPSTVQLFLSRGPRSGPRLLGWDTPENPPAKPDEPSVFGTLVSEAAYGHTGFTGTELWVDPVHDLFLVFLTNRTLDPKVPDSAKALRQVRAELSDAAVRLVPRACEQELVARC